MDQFYEVKVEGYEVLLNNVAFLKCVVPAHVREYVEITSWYRGEELLTDNSDISEYLELNEEIFTRSLGPKRNN